MWNYEKRLQYPINITQPNAKIAQYIMSQYGGRSCVAVYVYSFKLLFVIEIILVHEIRS